MASNDEYQQWQEWYNDHLNKCMEEFISNRLKEKANKYKEAMRIAWKRSLITGEYELHIEKQDEEEYKKPTRED